MRVLNVLPFLAGLSAIPTTLAWGAAGHEIVATIAQMYLDPTALPRTCAILSVSPPEPTSSAPLCHLAPIATWADHIRNKMRWSAVLHYVGALDDHPSQTCAFPGARGWAGARGANVLGGIRNTTGILEDWAGGYADDERANEALKFLVHFVGDMHMPLHLTGRDRGGNSVKVRFDGRLTNLHSLWDGLLIAKAIRTVPWNYTHALPVPAIERAFRGTIYDAYIRRIMWEGVLDAWKDELPSWLHCPVPPAPAAPAGLWQTVLARWGRAAGAGDTGIEFDDAAVCPYHWATPIHALNCEIVWPPALDEPPYNSSRLVDPAEFHDDGDAAHARFDEEGWFTGGAGDPRDGKYLELDTPEYAGVIAQRMLVEKLLAKAGIRLAGILNMLFADNDDGELNPSTYVAPLL